MQELWSFLTGTGAFLLLAVGFGFLIFVHELGHFLAAKAVGIKVTQFAIGFGHAVLCWRKGIGFRIGTTEPQFQRRIRSHLAGGGGDEPGEGPGGDEQISYSEADADRAARELGLGETEYRLNWMPLGGYVKMLGQDDLDPSAASDDPRAFNNKPFLPRAAVISAGVVMNAVFAVIFFIIAFLNGVAFPPPVIGDVLPGSPAAETSAVDQPQVIGLRPGDRVLAIDGEPTSDFSSLTIASALGKPRTPVDLLVQRPMPGEEAPRELRFRITPTTSDFTGLLEFGIAPPTSIELIRPTDPKGQEAMIERWGLRPGMRLVEADGRPVDAYWRLDRILQQSDGRPITLTFEDEQGRASYTLEPATWMQQEKLPGPGEQSQTVWHLFGLVPAVGIVDVEKDSAADGVLEAGDIIVSLDNRSWPTHREVFHLIAESKGRELPITVLRDGARRDLKIAPEAKLLGKPKLGVAPAWATDTPLIARVLDGSPFAALNLMPGTVIQEIGKQEVRSFEDLRLAVQQARPGPLGVTYTLPTAGGVRETAELTLGEATIRSAAALRWRPRNPLPFDDLRSTQQAGSIWQAVRLGVEKTHLFMVMTYVTLERLIVQRTVGIEHLQGPVGIAHLGTNIVLDRGVNYLIFFLGLISINLAVINFLPLPIVDGGLFVLLVIEKVRGRPVPAQVQSAINLAGLILLATIFITVTYYDIARLISG